MRRADKRIVVALGGNAILRSKQQNSYADQFDNIQRTCRKIVRLPLSELERLLLREPFSAGSMGPKVRAAYRFVHDGGGQATTCALEDALGGLRDTAGTLVVPDETMQLSFRT